MGIYKVQVTVSNHDALKDPDRRRDGSSVAVHWAVNGRTDFAAHDIVVEADSDHEAVLIASQMASCTGGMCTGAVLSDWPDS